MKKLYIMFVMIFVFFFSGILNNSFAQTFSAKTDFTTGTAPRLISIGDFNGDGKADIAVANESSTTVSVFLNTTTPGATTPTFSTKTDFTTGTSPISVSIGDLNGDGKLDMAVVSNGPNTVSVFLNTTTTGASTPTFSSKTDFTTGSGPGVVSIGDLNGDGKLDMAVNNYSSATVSVLLNTTTTGASTPTFSAKTDFTTGSYPFSVSIGDFNGDGKLDIAVANNSSTVSVLLNTTTIGASTPTFSAKTDFTTATNPVSISLGDINGDGKLDIAVACQNSSSVSILINTTTTNASTPTFSTRTDFATGSNTFSVSIVDINADGKPDMVSTNLVSNTASVFLNTTSPGASTPTFAAKIDFTTGTSPKSVSIGNFNGDGKPDMAVSNSGSNTVSVFLNTTTIGVSFPTFSAKIDSSTGTSPNSVSIGDFNRDGKPDIAVANGGSNSVSVFLNTTSPGASTSTFSAKTDFTTGASPRSVSLGDFNGDGKLDMAVTNYNSTSASVFLNTTTPGASTPTFSTKTDFTTGINPLSVSLGDFNGDGKLDMAVANYNSTSVSVFLNTTTPGVSIPTFSTKIDFTTGGNPFSVTLGDFNGDGKLDMAVASSLSNAVSVFLNTTSPGATTPTFSTKTDFTTGVSPDEVSLGDFNGDGKLDMAATNFSSTSVSVFLNTTTPGASTPTFSTKTDFITGSQPISVSAGDFNGDGKLDMSVANYSSSTISVFLNTTSPGATAPTFSAKTDFTTGTNPYSVSLGDFNGDGKLDMAVTNLSSTTVSVFLNNVTLPLPVELVSFYAAVQKNSIVLNWETATEVNNYGFEIQRASSTTTPSQGWEKIGFVAGHGNSNSPNSYSFTDQPNGGTSFSYRLKQIDVDGKFKIYDAITVSLSALVKAELMQNSPNPFNPSTAIRFYIPNESDVNIKIFDMLGKEVTTLINNRTQAGYHIVYWNGRDSFGNSAASGIYLYRLTAGSFIETKKMSLLK